MNTYIITYWYKSIGNDIINTFLIQAMDRDEAQNNFLKAHESIFGDVEQEVKDAYRHGQFFILKADEYTANVEAL